MKTVHGVLIDNGFTKMITFGMYTSYLKGGKEYDIHSGARGIIITPDVYIHISTKEINSARVTIELAVGASETLEMILEDTPEAVLHNGIDLLKSKTMEELIIYLKLIGE